MWRYVVLHAYLLYVAWADQHAKCTLNVMGITYCWNVNNMYEHAAVDCN